MGKNILIAYFSGTGGTEMIANAFEKNLLSRKYDVNKYSIKMSNILSDEINENQLVEQAELIFLLYAVHAWDAPEPVYTWMEKLNAKDKKVVVISVSAGGEVWLNSSCRANVCKTLKNKNYRVVYEKMMVMPNNFMISTGEHLSMHLINAIPDKVDKVLERVLAGKIRRPKPKIGSGLLRIFSKLEKWGAKKTGKKMKIEDSCTACGWCERGCPMGNIKIENKKPTFDKKCIICLKCIYGCPNSSIKLESFMIIKGGYNLRKLQYRMDTQEIKPLEQCKGWSKKGIKAYLTDADGY